MRVKGCRMVSRLSAPFASVSAEYDTEIEHGRSGGTTRIRAYRVSLLGNRSFTIAIICLYPVSATAGTQNRTLSVELSRSGASTPTIRAENRNGRMPVPGITLRIVRRESLPATRSNGKSSGRVANNTGLGGGTPGAVTYTL